MQSYRDEHNESRIERIYLCATIIETRRTPTSRADAIHDLKKTKKIPSQAFSKVYAAAMRSRSRRRLGRALECNYSARRMSSGRRGTLLLRSSVFLSRSDGWRSFALSLSLRQAGLEASLPLIVVRGTLIVHRHNNNCSNDRVRRAKMPRNRRTPYLYIYIQMHP